MTKRVEGSTRKIRSDKKKQYPLKFDKKDTHEDIYLMAFNTGQPVRAIINLLLEAALSDDEIINGIYAMYPPKDNLVVIRRS